MVGGNVPSEAHQTERAIFELERFSWGAPDQLQLLGRFVGLGEAPPEAPALVIRGAKRTHRLPVAADNASGPPQDRQRWRAAFRWEEAPEPFEVAELELGGLVVELPAPRSGRRAFNRKPLPVRQASAGRGEEAAPPEGITGRGEQVRLQVELAAAQDEISELRSALEQSGNALTRARDDLEAERKRHAVDAERFHQGLATIRASAEDALAAEQKAAEQRASELREARRLIAAREAELGALSDEVQTLRRELDTARNQALALQAESEAARSSAEDGRAEAERLLSHLSTLQERLDE
jgi:predicted  nucleic acid-binding Zn-ribbon protein